MRLNADDFSHLLDPPAHPLFVIDHMVAWVEPDHGAPFTALVLRIRHPELAQPYDQLFRLHPDSVADLADRLINHSVPPEE